MEIQWPLIFFTLLSTLAGGLFVGQGVLVLRGKGGAIHLPALIVEVAALAIGGLSAFFHLQHWERIFNGFGQLRSGITHELIGIVIFGISIIIFFVVLRRAKDTDALPKALGVFAIVIGLLVVYVTAASYDMPARPAWHTVMLYVYYYAEAFILGAAGLWALAGIAKAEDTYAGLPKWVTVAAVLSAIAIAIFGVLIANTSFSDVGLYFFDATDSTAAHIDPHEVTASILTGSNALLFWGGAVFLGAVVALILGLLNLKKSKSPVGFGTIAIVCSLAGGVAFRVIFYIVGISAWPFFNQ